MDLVNLPVNASPITDTDEEVRIPTRSRDPVTTTICPKIFLLYSALNRTNTTLVGPDGFRGLGHLDSRKDTLTVQFELRPPITPQPAKKSKKKTSKEVVARVIEIEIAQDPTALRSRNGDTGSVVWRARCGPASTSPTSP